MDADDEVAGRSSPTGPDWHDLLKFVLGSLAVTAAAVVYIPATGAPWNGVAAVTAVVFGVTTLLLLLATGVFYLLDEP